MNTLRETIILLLIISLFWPLVSSQDTIKPIAVINDMPEIVSDGMTLTMDASDSSDNIKVVRYDWTIGIHRPGLQSIYYYSDEMVFDYTFPYLGFCTIWLKVFDEVGNQGNDNIYFNITDITPPVPVCNDDTTIHTREPIILNGSRSSDNDRIQFYNWTVNNTEYSGPIQNLTFNDPDIINITLTVTDYYNLENSSSFILTILDTHPKISLSINGKQMNEREVYHTEGPDILCSLDASETYSYRAITSYKWQIETDTYDGIEILFRPPEEREYGVLLTVTNEVDEISTSLFYIDSRKPELIINDTVINDTENETVDNETVDNETVDNETIIPETNDKTPLQNDTIIEPSEKESSQWFGNIFFLVGIVLICISSIMMYKSIKKRKD